MGMLRSGRLIIHPLLEQTQIGPSTIDLRLNNEFRIFESRSSEHAVNPFRREEALTYTKRLTLEVGKPLVLQPLDFYLGSTFEFIKLPNDVTGFIEGRSSIGRFGVLVHATAGHIDPGFCGRLTFELINLGKVPVSLFPFTRVAQIYFIRMKEKQEYAGKYQYEFGPLESLVSEDEDLDKIENFYKSFQEDRERVEALLET